MNFKGKITNILGLTPFIDRYREGVRAPARYQEFTDIIKAHVEEINDLNASIRQSMLPPIMFNTLPKSGSVYIGKTLANSLNVEYLERNIFHGFFPNYFLIDYEATRLSLGNVIRQEHFNATDLNMMFLRRYLDRLVIHTRDPRQATLSWYHHFDRLRREHPDGVNYTVHQAPNGYDSWDQSEKLDWHISTHLRSCVDWISDWVKYAESSREVSVLFTRYEDFVDNQAEFFARIVDFYNIDQSLFNLRVPAKTIENNYRRGEKSEWKTVFSLEQRDMATNLIGPELLKRFNWTA